MEIVFWISTLIIIYTFGGYGLILLFILKIRNLFIHKTNFKILSDEELPEVCLIIAAYNERDYVDKKIKNSLALDYPKNRLTIIWINDGSDDGTPELVAKYPEIVLLNNPVRSGKIVGMNRGAEFSESPILVFSDANTMLSANSLRSVMQHFQDPTVGCVAGEKQFHKGDHHAVAAAGEGFYWAIESWLKRLDYQFYSTIGATGELFSIKRELFHPVEPDTLLDDFMISMRATEQGFRVAYEPQAIASENGSSSVTEEMKRKVRIAAGCYQSMFRLKKLLNPFFNFKLFFQYTSHKVLRWTLAPLALIILLISNILIITNPGATGTNSIYKAMLILQVCLYILALFGLLTQRNPVRIKYVYAPFYFVSMNFAMYRGFIRFLKGKQSVLWEKAKRA